MRYLINHDVIFWTVPLSVSELINKHYLVAFVPTFLHRLTSEASKYHMCKFYQIVSNSLQVIPIVHKLFDFPSYVPQDLPIVYFTILT